MAKQTRTSQGRLTPRDKHLAKEVGKEVAQDVVLQVREELTYSGPLPPASQLRELDEVIPGAADRVLIAFERQSRHRQVLERAHLQGDRKRSWAGLWLGFAVAVVGIVAGSLVAGFAQTTAGATAGGVIGGGSLAALAGCFIHGTAIRRKERERKAALVRDPGKSA